MTVGTSILLIVVGAILSYAITWELPAVDVAAVGVILMLAGLLGLAISVGRAFRPNRRVGQQGRLGPQYGRDGQEGQQGETLGEPPLAPRWNSCVPPPPTYIVPFDGHLAADSVPTTPVPLADRSASASDSPVVAPWYSAEYEPYVRPPARPVPPVAQLDDGASSGSGGGSGESDGAHADTDPDARAGPATWWPGSGT